MTCRNCIHFNDCLNNGCTRYYGTDVACADVEDRCNFFKDKSRFIEIPIELNQTVWFIRNNKIIETYIEKIIFKNNGLYIKLACNKMYETSYNSIGKTVFLKKEDAEKAIRKD